MFQRLSLVLIVVLSWNAHAYFQMDFLKNKSSQAKSSSRWTLADWLAQKQKNSLADQWLALHTSSNWFDLSLSGQQTQFEVKTTPANGTATTTKDGGQLYEADMYISIFNLNGEMEKRGDDYESYAGAAGIRLFGTSNQTTNLVVRYGLQETKNKKTAEHWDNQYAEAQLQLYVIEFFGLQGKYRHFFPDTSKQGNKVSGHKVTAGAFIEYGMLRIFADYFQEPMETSANGSTSKRDRTGMQYGLRLFF
jgi:hypothetical protein